jgi:CRP-like cAMP-binding protein
MSFSTAENDVCPASEYQSNLGVFRDIPFFAQLPIDAVKLFAYLCQRETFRKGDYLFKQGDDDGRAYYIVKGECGLEREGAGPGGPPLGGRGPGDFIGGLALLGPMLRVFSLRALTDLTCVVLERQRFQKALESYPQAYPAILKGVADGVRRWEETLYAGQDGQNGARAVKAGVSLL